LGDSSQQDFDHGATAEQGRKRDREENTLFIYAIENANMQFDQTERWLECLASAKTAYEPSHQELSPNDNNNYYPFTCKQLESIQAELEKFRFCFNGHKY
jgi:hypothetical protein